MLISALLMTAAIAGGDPDGVVSTAPVAPVALDASAQPEAASPEGVARGQVQQGLTTDQQIGRWIATRDPNETPYAHAEERSADDRKMHGMVDVGVGTGGYQSVGMAVSLPIGDSARLDLSYTQTRNDPRWGYYDLSRYDYGGYVFPGAESRDIAGPAFEERIRRPDGPPRRFTSVASTDPREP